MEPDDIPTTLPNRIRERIERLNDETEQIRSYALQNLTTTLPQVTFTYQHTAPADVLTDFERAQSVSFVTRYEGLPNECTVQVVDHEGEYQIANMGFLRHALNDWRPIIQLQSDPVYYRRVHNFWHQSLARSNPSAGLCIRAHDDHGNDVTDIASAALGERNRAIKAVLQPLEYGYLYNGVLQHSEASNSKRFLRDYTSGELNYILWKHAHMLGFIHEMLEPLHYLVNVLTFPRRGPL